LLLQQPDFYLLLAKIKRQLFLYTNQPEIILFNDLSSAQMDFK